MGTTAVASISERADSLPAAAALDVFDEWCSLFWSVDESVSILYQNAAASDLISRAVGLERHYGRLKCADPVDQEALIKMISVIPCSDPRASQPQSMRMSRTSRHQGLLVNSRLISVRHPEGDGSVQLCLLTILDREMRGVGPTASQLKQAFGLSRTEAAVAIGISNGVSPAEIAQRRRVTIDTVRAQLRFVYRKTGTSRQAELVRLVLQLAALGTHWAGEQRD